jgi:hypothetical protein
MMGFREYGHFVLMLTQVWSILVLCARVIWVRDACVCVYMYMYILDHTHVCMFVCIYI